MIILQLNCNHCEMCSIHLRSIDNAREKKIRIHYVLFSSLDKFSRINLAMNLIFSNQILLGMFIYVDMDTLCVFMS